MKLKLTDKHKKAFDCNGHLLVTGGPGSGKTTLALLKASQRIEQGIRSGENILFLSFSRAAVARIKESSQNHITKELHKSLSIQTYHSFFWEILRVFGYLIGAPKKLRLLTPYDERSLSGGLKPGKVGWDNWVIEREVLFNNDGNTAFDLFAPKVLQLVNSSSPIAQLIALRFPLIIVDEAQDTGSDQWSILKVLAKYTQFLFLGDLEQQIYDFIPGVGPERIQEIKDALNPEEVELGTENNRSPNTEIVTFGNDILNNKSRSAGYNGVSQMNYNPQAQNRDRAIRQSLGLLNKKIKDDTGNGPENIAFLSSYDIGVNIISAALRNGPNPIQHKVLFDETATLLSSRLLAFLLEPKLPNFIDKDLIETLRLLTSLYRAYGTAGKLKMSKEFTEWSTCIINKTRRPTTKLFKGIETLLKELQIIKYDGDPGKDWMAVRMLLKKSKIKELEQVDRDLQYLLVFNRGKRISLELQNAWTENGFYLHARRALDSALAEDQILSGIEDLSGIHVMTMHKSKGKQFDGVVIFRANNHSPFVWNKDTYPFEKSRKILRVAITRAKCHVIILNDVFPKCSILSQYSL